MARSIPQVTRISATVTRREWSGGYAKGGVTQVEASYASAEGSNLHLASAYRDFASAEWSIDPVSIGRLTPDELAAVAATLATFATEMR